MRKAAPKTAPKTFSDLVKNLETALKLGHYFVVVHNNGETEYAPLKSLKLREVLCVANGKKDKVFDVELIMDGLFRGNKGPHKLEPRTLLMAELGITELTVGLGSSPYANGTVGKGLSVKVSRALLDGSLAAELDELSGQKVQKAKGAALARTCKSKPYVAALQALANAEAEVVRFAAKADKIYKKVERMEARALEKAVAKVLPVSSRQSPKRKYKVIVA